MVKFKTLQQ